MREAAKRVAPWIPTPLSIVRAALRLAWISPCDTVYDLGAGDGRVVVIAASEYGVKRAVGVEIDEVLAEVIRVKAREKGVSDRVVVVEEDFFRVDLSDASLVYLYLYMSVNEALKPKLERELEDGARVVAVDFPVPGWVPVRVARIVDEAGRPRTILVYLMGLSNLPPYCREFRYTRPLRILVSGCGVEEAESVEESRGA